MESTAIVAFLGAALGAAVASWTTLTVDRKRREDAERHRYSPENRALFLEYLRKADARALAVRKQAEAAWEWSQGRIDEDAIPTLDTTDDLESTLHRIQDAMPGRKLSPHAAQLLLFDVLRLDNRSHRPTLAPFDPRNDAEWGELWTRYEESTELVRQTYQVDVGAAVRPQAPRLARAIQAMKSRLSR